MTRVNLLLLVAVLLTALYLVRNTSRAEFLSS